jgi:hypothetical protein
LNCKREREKERERERGRERERKREREKRPHFYILSPFSLRVKWCRNILVLSKRPFCKRLWPKMLLSPAKMELDEVDGGGGHPVDLRKKMETVDLVTTAEAMATTAHLIKVEAAAEDDEDEEEKRRPDTTTENLQGTQVPYFQMNDNGYIIK